MKTVEEYEFFISTTKNMMDVFNLVYVFPLIVAAFTNNPTAILWRTANTC